MTTPFDNQNNDTIVETDDYDMKNDGYPDDVNDLIYFAEYDYLSEQSVYSEPIAPRRDYRVIKKQSTLSKESQILVRREVPLKLRETIGRKYIKVPVYESSLTPNHRIKNAITGQITPHRVGTQAESLYFKVCLATGVDGRREPANLFFETPVEFERHFLEQLTDDVKEKWAERYRVVEKAYCALEQERINLHMKRFTFIH